jgi:thiosulfate/3-mercaptopyruvate sulfurtransferase
MPGPSPAPPADGGAELIDTATLAAELDRPELRLYDCTTFLDPAPAGSADPYIVRSGRDSFAAAHIPGADYLDLQGEFSDRDTALRFMLAPLPQLEAAFGSHGIAAGSRVVLYSSGSMMWATRFWWMLAALGHRHVAVLDGGLDKWLAEGRPTETGPPRRHPPATLAARAQPGLFVDRRAVLEAIGAPGTVILNALGPEFHAGLVPSRYGRPGRIPGSVNVPAATLVRLDDKSLISQSDAASRFAAAGVTRDKRVIAYCGGGISATLDLFVLRRLGFASLALYDGSMGEWARDPALPIERDPA